MLARFLPRSCSALSVFISYSHEQRRLAEELAQALKNAGHDVFFDVDSLPASAEYNDRIRSAIDEADRFVFIASKQALEPGKFTLTELQFAKQRWPAPQGKVVPVLVNDGVKVSDLPVYVRSVSVMTVQGNAVAEIVDAVQKTRRTGRLCKSVTAAAAASLVAGLAYVGGGFTVGLQPTDIVLMPPQGIHFRPVVDAPLKPDGSEPIKDWAASPLTVTVMPVAYTHRTEPGRRARVVRENVDLTFAAMKHEMRAIYIVEITDAPCGDRWFCIKGNAGVETIEPGASINRETMFVLLRPEEMNWRQFVDAMLATSDLLMTVEYRAVVEVSEQGGPKRIELRQRCGIDTASLRASLEKAGFKAGGDSKPVYVETDCLQQPDPSTPASASAQAK